MGFDRLTSDTHLRTFFSSFGEVAGIESKFDPLTGTPLGICRIQFRDSRSEAISAAEAAKRAEETGSGQRLGLKTVRVERDRVGRKCQRAVDSAARRLRERAEQEEQAREATRKEKAEAEASPAPPPNAPKGPASRPFPPRQAPSNPVTPVQTERPPISAAKAAADALIEKESVLAKIKRKPYIFIAHEAVPVMGTTIPHLKKRMKSYDWQEVRLDKTGYFVVFEDSRRGENEAVRCYNACHKLPLFTYTMIMELQEKGNPNYVRSPSPERAQAVKREQEVRQQFEQDEQDDREDERRRRAEHLDPVHAAMEQLRIEILNKILQDVKSRIAVKALNDFMAPENHVERRQKMNIADPHEQTQTAALLPQFAAPANLSRRPTERLGPGGLFKKTRGPSSVSISRDNSKPVNVYAEERRRQSGRPKKPTQQSLSLHQQLAGFASSDESDEEFTRSSREVTKDRDVHGVSRMSSTAPTEDTDDATPRRRQRLQKELSQAADDDSEGEDLEGVTPMVSRELLRKDFQTMTLQELVDIVKGTIADTKYHDLAKREITYRQRQKAAERMFNEDSKEDADTALLTEIGMSDILPTVELEEPLKGKKKPKTKRKSKKQLFEEREAAKAAEAEWLEKQALAVADTAMPDADAPTPPEEDEEEGEERPEIEWAVSHTIPKKTVVDDPTLVLDLDGWQTTLKDAEDFRFLQTSLDGVKPATITNVPRWAIQQKDIKAMNTSGLRGPLYDEMVIKGYYVPNASGSARTEGVKKIVEAEKSKYLPHRLKVAAARERRQAEAKSGAPAVVEAAKQSKVMVTTASSRSNRASKRTHAKDINALNTAKMTVEGHAGDMMRFNNLQKRKKLVKFDRSAIHGWGLYAEENIAINDMIIEYVGEKVRQAVANIREIRYDRQGVGSSYLFRIDEDTVVDATKKGGIARFINHSCAPNCTAKIIRVDGTKRIVIYALREIAKSEFP